MAQPEIFVELISVDCVIVYAQRRRTAGVLLSVLVVVFKTRRPTVTTVPLQSHDACRRAGRRRRRDVADSTIPLPR